MPHPENPPFELERVKVDLAAAIFAHPDTEKAREAFGLVHGANTRAELAAVAERLRTLVPNKHVGALLAEVEKAVMETLFPKGSVREMLMLAAVKSSARETVASWLQAMDERLVKDGIYAVASAMEAVMGVPFEKAAAENILKSAGGKEDLWKRRNDEYRGLARDVVSAFVAQPDLRLENLMSSFRPDMNVAMGRGIFGAIQTQVKNGIIPPKSGGTAPAVAPSTNTANSPGNGEKKTAERFMEMALDASLENIDEVVAYHSAAPSLEKERMERQLVVAFESVRYAETLHKFGPLLLVVSRLKIVPRTPVTEPELRRMYIRVAHQKMTSDTLRRFSIIMAGEFFELCGVNKGDWRELEKRWQPVKTPPPGEPHRATQDSIQLRRPGSA